MKVIEDARAFDILAFWIEHASRSHSTDVRLVQECEIQCYCLTCDELLAIRRPAATAAAGGGEPSRSCGTDAPCEEFAAGGVSVLHEPLCPLRPAANRS
jgi:hypothetical protein